MVVVHVLGSFLIIFVDFCMLIGFSKDVFSKLSIVEGDDNMSDVSAIRTFIPLVLSIHE